MKVAVFEGVGKPLSIREVEVPKPPRGMVLVRNHRCGICGTDLHMTSGHGPTFPAGMVIGHEVAAEVVELGAGVEGLKVGDKVVPHGAQFGCTTCAACQMGEPQYCSCPDFGAAVVNGYGQYGVIKPEAAMRLPQALSLDDGALIEPLACALNAVGLAEVKPGARVLVLGAGPMGLGCAYFARRQGAAKVVVMSRSRRREAMALQFGATGFVEGPDTEDAKARSEALLGGPPEVVFECVGAAGMISAAIDHVRQRGVVVVLGYCTAPETILSMAATLKAVRLQFAFLYSLRDYEAVASLFDAGQVEPRAMITEKVSLARLPEVFESLRGPNAQCKVIVEPWAD
jgi:2-desacetyl-2-hydroxyethyl bacteriochlorophyllide A dehydrogenase